MKLKNDALQELYDTLVNQPITLSAFADSTLDKAFRECDEKLQKDIDIWKCGNEILISTNTDLASDRKRLKEEIEELKKKNADLKKACDEKSKANVALITSNTDLSDRLAKLQKHHDHIDRCWTSQIQENIELKKQLGDTRKNVDGWRSRAQEAEKRVGELLLKKYDQSFEDLKKDYETVKEELDDTKSQLNYYKHSYYDLCRRAHHAEDEVEDLKNKCSVRDERIKELIDREKNLDFYFNKYQELKKDYDKLSEENRKLNARTDCLREEVLWYRKHYKEQSDKIQELKSRLNSMYGIPARDLWDMLQNVNDSQPNEFDVECESMHDVIGMDLDDFLDAYKKWQEQKEIDRMRNWLAYFCTDRDCKGCPLESVEYKCGCGYSFKKANPFDTRIIPDEDDIRKIWKDKK